MTHEEQRIKIAELRGFRWYEVYDHTALSGRRLCFRLPPECGVANPHWKGTVSETWFADPQESLEHVDTYCPDYPNDLNAMHEAEKMLTVESGQVGKYLYELEKVCVVSGCEARNKNQQLRFIRATAAQRAEAFLRTLNLWKE